MARQEAKKILTLNESDRARATAPRNPDQISTIASFQFKP